MDTLHILIWIGNIIPIFSAVGVFLFWEKASIALKVVSFYFLGIFTLQMLTEWMIFVGEANTQYLSHFYVVGQLIFLSVFYFLELKRFKIIPLIGSVLFFLFIILQISIGSIQFEGFNTPGYLASACIIMTYCMGYFMENIQEKYYLDWMNIGLFLYLGGSSILFFTMNYWKDLGDWNELIWMLNAILFIVFHVFVMISILQYKKEIK